MRLACLGPTPTAAPTHYRSALANASGTPSKWLIFVSIIPAGLGLACVLLTIVCCQWICMWKNARPQINEGFMRLDNDDDMAGIGAADVYTNSDSSRVVSMQDMGPAMADRRPPQPSSTSSRSSSSRPSSFAASARAAAVAQASGRPVPQTTSGAMFGNGDELGIDPSHPMYAEIMGLVPATPAATTSGASAAVDGDEGDGDGPPAYQESEEQKTGTGDTADTGDEPPPAFDPESGQPQYKIIGGQSEYIL